MSISDQTVLNDIQLTLLETANSGASWSSNKWTASEVVGYANKRQYDFLRRTGILLKRSNLNTFAYVNRLELATDHIETHRVVWRDINVSPNVYTEIPRSDGYEADHAVLDWPANAATLPAAYTDGEVPSLQLQLMPAPSVGGQVQVLHSYLSTLLTAAGVNFIVPDEFVPALKWGIMADMLGKVGRAHDPARAEYCESRYAEAVEAAKIMLSGWA